MKRRSGFVIMARLIGLVKPLTGFMVLAITMGLIGNLCATFITILGGYAVLNVLGFETPLALGWIFATVLFFALVRSSPATTLSPSNCWPSSGTRCFRLCGSCARRSWRVGTGAT